jgi:CRP/FNR family transcriptional regulator, anaerobic regulatory protein
MTLSTLTPLAPAAAPRERDTFADVMCLLGVAPGLAEQAAARMPVAARRVRALAPLFVEGSRADAMYLVRLGTFKAVRVDGDGYEQVLDFAGRGELLGCEALGGLTHAAGAVALEDSAAWVMPVADLNALRRAVPAFDDALQRALARQLLHAGEMAELMSAVAAEVRLARFLVHQSARMVARGQSPRRLLLRMSRRDIASYLGLAHETISRALALLSRWGCVRVHNREVEIVEPNALAACARSTRGRWAPASEPARLAA